MKLIERNDYLNRLINVIGTADIKIITGVRRSGKSKLLEAFKKYIEENSKKSNIIHINFNLPEYENLTDVEKLKAEVLRLHTADLGITLNKDIHILFHRLYGKGNNTPEQLYEYIENYKKLHKESQNSDSLLLCSNL